MCAEPVASPPPPYSPRREPDSQDSPRRPVEIVSPSDTTSPDTEASYYNSPVSAATTLSPELMSRYQNSPPPALHQHVGQHESSSAISGAPSFPPPPPVRGVGQRTRAASKNTIDLLLSSSASRGEASTALPPNAIDAPQPNTVQILAHAPIASPIDDLIRAPTARRAASTGCIGLAGGSSRSATHSPGPTLWEPGMLLPPPPPGPPPAAARSQSLNRSPESSSHGPPPNLSFRQRRPPGRGTFLDTVPPTPADWREENTSNNLPVSSPHPISKESQLLHIDTSSILQKERAHYGRPQIATVATHTHIRRDSTTGALFRSPAVRDRSAKGIRERRSESRNGKSRAEPQSAIEPPSAVAPWDYEYNEPKPIDLVLAGSQANVSKHRLFQKLTPKSSKSIQSIDGALKSAEINPSSAKALSSASSRTTPQPGSSFSQRFSASTSTPPFSPDSDGLKRRPAQSHVSPAVSSKPFPSPPLRKTAGPSLSLLVPPGPEQRPISHLLHTPNPEQSIQVPLTPSIREAIGQVGDLLGPESPRAFAGRAIERHRIFAENEAAAASDSERLDLYIKYMTAESRIRREQYASVFEEESIDIDDLTQGLFGQPNTHCDSHGGERASSRADTSKRTSIASSAFENSSSQGDTSAASRMQESPSSATTNSSIQNRQENNWCRDYVPSLSPIASLSAVTGQDEMDSRGRAPSRWWEDRSHSGNSALGEAFNVLERSKRESKYMGVPPTLPAMYEGGDSASASNVVQSRTRASQSHVYGLDEYPPEKIGWHDQASPEPPPAHLPPAPLSAPYTPDSRGLDISRLVTLPPPYPRHHPAVNNNHPDLVEVRTVVRSLNEKDEIDSIKQTYETQIFSKRQRADSWCKRQRSLFTQEIEFRIDHGEITEKQYDEARKDHEATIHGSEKDIAQADFDLFQDSVLTPLHVIFSNRIKLATSSLDKLSSRLFSDAQSRSPNLPQEEGDEQPELLEKLTQLKWLFEAREGLHRQHYDLLSERNNRYKDIVILPYKQTQSSEKFLEADAFFAQDARERRLAFEQAVYSRAQAFLSVIENNVSRGVEVQLSAFWDIAPSLLEVLQKIPSNLHGFIVSIPANEYDENPSYYSHPLQYLYSLLGHAEKSSYQFIESQINLLCLLHEIRSHALIERCRVAAQSNDRPWEVEIEQQSEERKLTADLKDKVGVVEGQWEEALAKELMEVRERVRGWLLEEGGFDEEDIC